MMALMLPAGGTHSQLGCPQREGECMEGLVAMSVLKGPRYHQPQSQHGIWAVSEGCSGMDGDSIPVGM